MWKRTVKLNSQYQLIELFVNDETGHVRMDINGCTQFHSADEYRYHELAIFAPFVCAQRRAERVLILGGGDGLAAREALKFAARVDLVDIDEEVVRLSIEDEHVKAINQGSLLDERVHIYFKDAVEWLPKCRSNKYDLVFADYPDPTSPALDKLFTLEHYQEMARVLKPGGVCVVQAGGALLLPVMANIFAKLKVTFTNAVPLKVEMLSGTQGFVMGGDIVKPDWSRMDGIQTMAFDTAMLTSATSWSKDLRQYLLSGRPEESAYDNMLLATAMQQSLASVGGL